MDIISDIFNFFGTILNSLVNFIGTFLNSITKGVGFVFSMFTVVPNYLMENFFPSMPSFFQDALYGLLGFMIFVLVTKILMSIKG